MTLPYRFNNVNDGHCPTVCAEDKPVQSEGKAAVHDVCHLPTCNQGFINLKSLYYLIN